MKFRHNMLSLIALAFAVFCPLDGAHAASNNFFCVPQVYTPILKGQTEDPGATYTTQQGDFCTLGNYTYVSFNLVTSGTTTKTTLTDNFAVSLPVPSVTQTNNFDTLNCDVENATAVSLGLTGVIGSATSQATFNTYTAIVAGKASIITWAATTPGIGGLTTVITAKCSGWYQSSAN